MSTSGAVKALARRRNKGGKMMKRDGGQEYPAEAYAYVPSRHKPSTWKIRLWESPEKKVTRAQVGRAMAALSSGGFRGQKAQIPAGDLAAVKAKVRAAWNKTHTKGEKATNPAIKRLARARRGK